MITEPRPDLIFSEPERAGPSLRHSDPAEPVLRDTTRYMCAATYQDLAFRQQVLKHDIVTVRARAPEFGIDVKQVLEHGRQAERILMWRDGLVSLFALALVVAGIGWMISQSEDLGTQYGPNDYDMSSGAEESHLDSAADMIEAPPEPRGDNQGGGGQGGLQ